jgi:hypothetical protein
MKMPLGGVEDELEGAIEGYPATPNVRSTADHLLELVKTRTDPEDLAVIIGD